ncbi:hypothetical protein WA026_015604 [Henosepilachna vigintioctopunctata]|uniref:protein-histidine N-methyltransferase n=1 Tax=Henosepilachna vigintioctopunctata TaxID=420089 RepID=A0AAW1VAB3_9CUCU
MTRQNTIPGVDGINQTALVPLWDLLNHTQGKISTDYNPILKRIECLALRDFKCGEQLFIFYGPRSNGEFFIHNGFVPDNNEYDNYIIKLGISKSDPLKEKRSLILQKISLANIHQFCLKKGPVQIPQNLVAFVRIFCMDEDQLHHWLESDNLTDLGYEACTVDLALEKKSWIFLQTRLKLILAAYKTTVDEDLSLLNENKLPPNITLALKMRYSEKVIIRDNIEWLKQRIEQ